MCRAERFRRGLRGGPGQGRLAGAAAAPVRTATGSAQPPGSELWLDGGHNPDGGRAVAGGARRPRGAGLAPAGPRGRHAARPRTAKGFLRNFAGLARRVIAVPILGQEKALPPETIADSGAPRRHAGRPRQASSRRSMPPAGSISSGRRASSSPARSTSPARCWRSTGRCRCKDGRAIATAIARVSAVESPSGPAARRWVSFRAQPIPRFPSPFRQPEPVRLLRTATPITRTAGLRPAARTKIFAVVDRRITPTW